MTDILPSPSDIPFGDSMLEAGASLESILCTEELQRRPSRQPDYEKENRALVTLASALADSPSTIFQTLADTILAITECDSAGLSLLTVDGKKPDARGKRFYWPAITGMWNPHVGGGTPRHFGPCGDVLDHNRTLLFRHFERRYPYLLPVVPAAEECLLIPFYVGGKAVGTIWAIMHSERRRFDAEDDRLLSSLGTFASSAYQAVAHIDDLKVQIIERERAEAEAHQLARGLEAKIRRLVEANVVGIVLWNLEGSITGANEAFLHMVQYAADDIAAGRLRWTDLTPEEWHASDERALADLKAFGLFKPFEKEYFRRDGSRIPVLLGGTLFERDGNDGVAFVLDLTEQKQAEEAVRRSETFLAEVQTLSHTGSWGLNTATSDLFWSRETYRIFGFESDVNPTVGMVAEAIHPDDRARFESDAETLARDRTDFERDYRLKLRDDAIKHVHVVGRFTARVFPDLDFIGSIMDVTERKQAADALLKTQAELAEVTRRTTMGELAASIAHEINQPLATVVTNAQTCADLLRAQPPPWLEVESAVSDIAEAGKRASDVIARIRLLLRKGVSEPVELNVNDVVRDVLALTRETTRQKRVMLETRLMHDVPRVLADRVQLQQVLINLITNAADAMADVTDRPRMVTISSSCDDRTQVEVAVIDSGSGIDPKHRDRIFDPFFTTKADGMGMGLAICRGIVEACGGRLWATPNPDFGGTTVRFSLPAIGIEGP